MPNRLQFQVGLDGSGFEKGIARLGATGAHSLKNFVAGAFGVFSIQQALHKTVETAEELVTTSKRLDTTVEQLQILRQAAKESGVEFEKLAGAFDRVNVARDKALSGGEGSGKLLQAFARLGVSPEMLRTQTAAQLFTGPISQKVKSSNVADVAGPLRDIFARGFGELIPVLKTDFEELEKKMRSLGSIMSTEAAVQTKILADEFGLLSNIIVSQLAPALGMLGPALLKFWGALQTAGSFWVTLFSHKDNTWANWLKSLGEVPKHREGAGWKERYFGSPIKDPSTPGINAGIDAWEEAKSASEETANEQEKLQQAFEQSVKEMIDALLHPKPPQFNPPDSPDKPKHTKLETSDALVRVGNFLGSSRNMIESLAERQVDLLQRIEQNTRPVTAGGAGDDTHYP